jgi:hypothetical protein
MNKNAKLALYAIPLAVGAYLIYRQFRRPKATDIQDAEKPQIVSGATYEKSDFPLAKGSKNNTVKSLQNLLNIELAKQGKVLLIPDGIFGSKTEAALVALTGKSSVQNQAEFNQIKTSLSQSNLKAANLDWAWKLIEAFDSGRYQNLVVKSPLTLIEVKKNFQGVWKPTGKSFDLSPIRFNLNDYALRSALTDGTMRIEILRGDFAGMYKTDPNENLSTTLDIE